MQVTLTSAAPRSPVIADFRPDSQSLTRGVVSRAAPFGLLGLCGCNFVVPGQQSALDPAGHHARLLFDLWNVLWIGAAAIWLVVAGVTVFVLVRRRSHPERWGNVMIWGGGVIFPVAVLSALLPYSLWVMTELRAEPTEPAMRIEVIGQTWWWEVVYTMPETGERVVSANEVRLPVDRPVEVVLTSRDVIHSFWIPALAGKLDLIPGRVNSYVIEADRVGLFRGQCAEFCGASHAWMAFAVLVMEEEAFDEWLEAEAAPYRLPLEATDTGPSPAPIVDAAGTAQSVERAGLALFLDNGCGACHAIRGTAADGQLGPDLTHVGGRLTLAAGLLPNNVGTLAGWIANAQQLKPDNRMPSFNTLSGAELRTLAAFLSGLR